MRIDVDSLARALAGRTPSTEPPNGPQAAVAAVLRQDPTGAEVLLIRRARLEGDPWSGHMAFPGGRRSHADRDLFETALRETREEVGVDLSGGARLLGRLDSFPAMARGRPMGLSITPFVFELFEDAPLQPRPGEVDEALWTTLGPLAAGARDTRYSYDLDGSRLDLPAFDVEGRIVWGLTHRMITTLLALVR